MVVDKTRDCDPGDKFRIPRGKCAKVNKAVQVDIRGEPVC